MKAALVVLAALLVLPAGFAAPAVRPNILLIVADDHGLDALGCYGNPVIKTPHLDALAADGTRFTHAFCTTASCSPSRSVLLTGQHGHRNGSLGRLLPGLALESLPEGLVVDDDGFVSMRTPSL